MRLVTALVACLAMASAACGKVRQTYHKDGSSSSGDRIDQDNSLPDVRMNSAPQKSPHVTQSTTATNNTLDASAAAFDMKKIVGFWESPCLKEALDAGETGAIESLQIFPDGQIIQSARVFEDLECKTPSVTIHKSGSLKVGGPVSTPEGAFEADVSSKLLLYKALTVKGLIQLQSVLPGPAQPELNKDYTMSLSEKIYTVFAFTDSKLRLGMKSAEAKGDSATKRHIVLSETVFTKK